MPKYNQLTEQFLVELAPHVQKGAAYLDRYCRETGFPDWRILLRHKIEKSGFDMTECSSCTLGLLFGEYMDGLGIVFETRNADEQDRLSTEHGFLAPESIVPNFNTYRQDAQFKALEILWLRAIGLPEDQLSSISVLHV